MVLIQEKNYQLPYSKKHHIVCNRMIFVAGTLFRNKHVKDD